MVLYTDKAREANGGHSGMRSLIALRIGYLNTIFVNSGIAASARLVHYAESPVTQQASNSEALQFIRTNSTVVNWRNTYGADLVAIITSMSGGWGDCFGSGSSFAHSSTSTNPSTFAHEVGHNLGSNHAADDPGLVCNGPDGLKPGPYTATYNNWTRVFWTSP
jgi:hypothetical protein